MPAAHDPAPRTVWHAAASRPSPRPLGPRFAGSASSASPAGLVGSRFRPRGYKRELLGRLALVSRRLAGGALPTHSISAFADKNYGSRNDRPCRSQAEDGFARVSILGHGQAGAGA